MTRLQSQKMGADMEALGFEVVIDVPGAVQMIVPDTADPDSKFLDKRVRLAISYAIDREAIAKALGYGVWRAIYQLPNPGTMAYLPELEGLIEYNPDKARQLLADAGYPNGFKTMMIPDFVMTQDLPVAVQQYLGEVGIVVDLDFMDPGSYFQYRRDGWNDLMYSTSSVLAGADFAMGLKGSFTASTWPSVMHPSGFDELATKALETPDPETQKALYQELNRLIFDEVMVIPVCWESRGYVFAEGVHDTGFDTYSQWTAWHPENAWLEKSAWIED